MALHDRDLSDGGDLPTGERQPYVRGSPEGGATIHEIEPRHLEEQEAAVVRGRMDADELTSWLSGVYGTLAWHLQRIGVATAGSPFVRFHARGGHVEVEAGLPTTERVTPKDEVVPSALPGGPAAVTWHTGPPKELDAAFEALDAWLEQSGVEAASEPWAVHHIDPTATPDRDGWSVEVIQPYRD